MFDPHRRDQDSVRNTPHISVPTRSSVLDTPSLFIASMVEVLRSRESDNAQACAESMARQGVLTGSEFLALIDTLPHPSQTSEVLWAYSKLTRSSVEADFAQGLPAFLKLAYMCFVESPNVDQATAKRVYRVLERVLDARIKSDDFADLVEIVVGETERSLLQSISMRGDQKRPGYWQCVELHGALFPDTESLDSLFCAVDRLGPGPYEKASRLGIEYSVAAIGRADFSTAFEFVAHALDASDRAGDRAPRRAAAAGLSFQSQDHLDELLAFLDSDDDTLLCLACGVCGSAFKGSTDDELPCELREGMAVRLRALVDRFRDRGAGDLLLDESLIALGHISPWLRDIDEIGRMVSERLSLEGPLSADLIGAYAEGLSRVKRIRGVVSLKPLSLKRFNSLDSPASMDRKLDGRSWITVGHETNQDVEALALDISVSSKFEPVLELCGQRQDLLDPTRLSGREASSFSFFFDGGQALRFARHHAYLATFGPAEFAAVLLPELLSAVACGRSRDNRKVGGKIGGFALDSLASLAKLAAHDAKIRDLAVARLSSADWDFLGRLHKSNERSFADVYPELGLAGFALRSVLDDEDTPWQNELLSWWRRLAPHARYGMDPNGLEFVAVVAEQHRPGAVWSLLEQLSLSKEDRRAFSDIGLALLARSEDSVQRICGEILSERGDDLARSLILAQLLTSHCGEEQRAHLLEAAKGLLDEMGILGLDAVATVGSLSRDRADAVLLLEREPVLGISEDVYRVSCARAAARILRNMERAASD